MMTVNIFLLYFLLWGLWSLLPFCKEDIWGFIFLPIVDKCFSFISFSYSVNTNFAFVLFIYNKQQHFLVSLLLRWDVWCVSTDTQQCLCAVLKYFSVYFWYSLIHSGVVRISVLPPFIPSSSEFSSADIHNNEL